MTLKAQIAQFEAAPGEIAVWSLGQSGFVLKGRRGAAVVDPYLSNSVEEGSSGPAGRWARLFSAPIAGEELSGVDVILATHVHDDHCDRSTIEALLSANPNATVCGPYPVRDMLAKWGVPARQVMAAPFGRPEHVGDLEVTAVPSAHYEFEPNAAGEPAYAGYVIELNGVRIYHAGDTRLYDGLADRIGGQIDLALLPVNGRDAVRESMGITGNTDAREAFWLADAIGSPLVVPMHNDLFAVNCAPWSNVRETLDSHYPHLRCHRLLPGEMMVVRTANASPA